MTTRPTTTAASDEEPPPPPAAPPPLPSTKSRSEDDIFRQYDSSQSYSVSSASSNNSHGDKFVVAEGTPPLIRHRKSSSDEFVVQPASSFTAAFYDSDGSDGSLVFFDRRGGTPTSYDLSKNNPKSSPRLGTGRTQHERWGSMDSHGSRGEQPSPMHLRTTTPQQQQQHLRHAAAAASPQNNNNYTPQVLPYHQRRKLLQQRQRQQQQLQQQTPNDDPIFTPDSVASAFAGGLYSSQQPQQTPAARTKSAPHQKTLSSDNSKKPSPGYQSRRPVPLDTISPSPHPRPTPKQYMNHPPPAPPPPPPPLPHPHSLPPSKHNRSYSGNNSGSLIPNRGRDSNAYSESWQHRQPPPPPPPPPFFSHIRADSSGSVSSLGSGSDQQQQQAPPMKHMTSLTDRLDQDIAGFLQEEGNRSHALPPPPSHQKQELHERNKDGGSGFLLGLFNISPKQQLEKKPNVEDYHQRNQAFLQRAERERAKLLQKQQPYGPFKKTASPRHVFKKGSSPQFGPFSKKSATTSPRPPNSRGVHRPGLSSIDNDNWEEQQDHKGRSIKNYSNKRYPQQQQQQLMAQHQQEQQEYSQQQARAAAILARDQYQQRQGGVVNQSSFVSSSQDDESDDETSGMDRTSSPNPEFESDEANERTLLLPPSGISTQEGERYTEKPASSRLDWDSKQETIRWDNRQAAIMAKKSKGHRGKNRRKKSKKDKSRSRRRRQPSSSNTDDSDQCSEDASHSSSSTSSSHYDYKRWAKKRAKMFEKERTKLIAQWKAEARAEAEAARQIAEANRWYKRLARWIELECAYIVDRVFKFLATAETFFCNLPLTVGAVALAIATLGVVWFKFAEENLASCEPVHFHSSQCTFPEFPGCFYCDKHTKMYQVALHFHFTCSAIAGLLAMCFMAKVVLAFRVVLDEMSSPTTSSPAGLICMTTVCVFAGRGWVGQILVSAAALLHLGLVIWFIYMALAYHIMPEPSWYPNTVGIGLSAVKTWLYYPMPGHFLMAISLSLNFFFFPISLIRVTLNQKISAPVCWIQMSAPAISLYALTIMAQPSFEEEHPDVTSFQRVHRMVYLPCMHFLFVLAVVGVLSSVQSLATRWKKFQKHEFSPAHAAFCFPTLAHANSIQAYRAAIDAFSEIRPGSPFKIALYTYWVFVLMSGTVATLYVTAKFFYHLPSWTQVDVADEEEPPAPNETRVRDVIATGETLRQDFVSPAVLQANETGALVFLRRGEQDGRGRYVRTRRLPALGFEPTMNWSEMNAERDVLLDWVAKNPPRRRKKTLSVPGIDFNYGFGDFGTGNSGVYGVEEGQNRGFPTRERSSTFDDAYRRGGYY